jgi:MerR family transcriptional regulator, light-induced transcriptional regulator
MASSPPTTSADGSAPPAVWPVGKVAAILGIPAVTIRTWEARYGIAPERRSPGLHRRYSSEDVARLRRMQRLISAGTPPGDAARLSAVPDDTSRATADQVEALLGDLEAFRVDEVAAVLDSNLRQRGIEASWDGLVMPALRRLEERFLDSADCTDMETLLADQTAQAVDRYVNGRAAAGDGPAPVLLACCPGERHWLPLKVLQGALQEHGTPALLLAPDLPADAVAFAVRRAKPRAVVLWALQPQPEQAALRRRLLRRGTVALFTAGPGWSARTEPLMSLSEAVTELTGAASAR